MDAALEGLYHDLRQVMENIPPSEVNSQAIRDSLMEFCNENFRTFKQNFCLEFDGTQKLNSQKSLEFEKNVHLALEKLKEEVFAKISLLEAYQASQTVNFEHKIDISCSSVQEAVLRHFTNSLAKAEKNFSDAFRHQNTEFSSRLSDLEKDQKTLQQFLKRLEKRQSTSTLESSSPKIAVDFLEHEVEEKLTNLRRDLSKKFDGNVARLQEEINQISDHFAQQFQQLRANLPKVTDQQIISLEKNFRTN